MPSSDPMYLSCTGAKCATPPTVPHARAGSPSNDGKFPSSMLYTCDAGYTPDDSSMMMNCSQKGVWEGEISCAGIPCSEDVPDVLNAVPGSPSNGGRYPSSIEYTCESGYEHAADTKKQCKIDGKWSNNVKCVGVPCSQTAPPIPNAVAQPASNGGKYPSNIDYKCEQGYTHTGMQNFKSCTASGSWTGSVQCTALKCPVPPKVANAQAASPSNGGRYPSSVSYACAKGFELEDPKTDSNKCDKYASWSDDVRCRGILCKTPPPVQHANLVDPSATRRYPSSIAYACQSGYEAVDSSVAKTCNPDGTWSGTVKCVEKKCKVVLGKDMIPHGDNGCTATDGDEIFLTTVSNKKCDVKCSDSSENLRTGIS